MGIYDLQQNSIENTCIKTVHFVVFLLVFDVENGLTDNPSMRPHRKPLY